MTTRMRGLAQTVLLRTFLAIRSGTLRVLDSLLNTEPEVTMESLQVMALRDREAILLSREGYRTVLSRETRRNAELMEMIVEMAKWQNHWNNPPGTKYDLMITAATRQIWEVAPDAKSLINRATGETYSLKTTRESR